MGSCYFLDLSCIIGFQLLDVTFGEHPQQLFLFNDILKGDYFVLKFLDLSLESRIRTLIVLLGILLVKLPSQLGKLLHHFLPVLPPHANLHLKLCLSLSEFANLGLRIF